MAENKLITPRKLAGFWELMPNEQICFSSMLNKLEDVFKTNCFVPLDTPICEYSEALLAKSGGETDKQVFRFTKGDTDMCMRYDLTVPLARFVAMHENELCFPFKRYQIGKVFRGERPQKGRSREFFQCDADIIGDGELSIISDAECVYLFEQCFNAIGVDVTIKISNRKILSGVFEDLGLTKVSHEILTILDKLDKISVEDAKKQLFEIVKNEKTSEKLLKLAQINGNFEEIATFLNDFCKNELFETGVKELSEINENLKSLGAKNYCFDISIIRGHDYYTGTVFEAFLKGEKIALGGGGRYENLCGYFSKRKMPGVGMSVGITRVFELLKDKFVAEISCGSQVGVINFDNTLGDALKITTTLRKSGVKADCLYESKTFKAKMKEANKRSLPFVLIVGEDEVKENLFTLKNMETGEQEKLSLSDIVKKVQSGRM